jgi:hypothetical protein
VTAAKMFRRTLSLAMSASDTDRKASVRLELRETESAIRLKDSPMRRRVDEGLCSFALWESAVAPKEAEARLWRYRWSALRSGERRRASVFLVALVNLAIRMREVSKERRLARKLLREHPTAEAWHIVACAEERAGNAGAARGALESGLRLARRKRDRILVASLLAKLEQLPSSRECSIG